MTDPVADIRHKSPGWLPLPELGLLSFEGANAAAFLQGYLTSDTAQLSDQPAPTALCDIKGRTRLTGYAWRQGDTVQLAAHQSLGQVTLDFLKPYLAFSRIRAIDQSADTRIIGLICDKPRPPALDLGNGRQLLALADEDATAQGAGIAPHDLQQALAQAIGVSKPEAPLPRRLWQAAAVSAREVWLQAETAGLFLPQMLGLDAFGSVSFAKGCYLGQEVIARAQHRGAVKRLLTAVSWRGPTPATGATLHTAEGRAAGVLVAVAEAADGDSATGTGLAVVKRGLSDALVCGQTRFGINAPAD